MLMLLNCSSVPGCPYRLSHQKVIMLHYVFFSFPALIMFSHSNFALHPHVSHFRPSISHISISPHLLVSRFISVAFRLSRCFQMLLSMSSQYPLARALIHLFLQQHLPPLYSGILPQHSLTHPPMNILFLYFLLGCVAAVFVMCCEW